MKLLTAFSFLGLAALAVATPIADANPAPEAAPGLHMHSKRCPNHGSQVACEQACRPVVQKACASCKGNPSCVIACEGARYKSCYSCCDKKCSTC